MHSRTTLCWGLTVVTALAAVLTACDLTRAVESAGTGVVQLAIVPDTVTLDPSQTQQFRAYGRTQAGDSVGILTTWSATGGAIAFSGLFTAGAQEGDYRVTAFIPPLQGQPPQNHSATVRVRRRGLLVRAVVVPGSPTVVTAGTQQFAAYGLLDNGDSVAVSVTWSASSGTISPSGLYTAALTPGGDIVLATASGTTGAAIVAVTNVPIASIAVSPASATVSVGSTQPLSAVVKDAAGTVLTGRTVTWATSSGAVATVSSSGLVTGAAVGTATITATSEGKSGSATVTVANLPVASVAVSPAAPNIYVGGSVQITATPKDANGTPLSGRTVTWTTSNSTVATVSPSGLVTGLAVGSATITATSEGQSGTAAVTVSTVPVASVVVSPAAANVSVGGTAQLSATLKDAAGNVLTGRAVTWTSSNPAIATVSAAGLVTGVAAGTATITATSEGQSGSATVTVANLPVASVAVSPTAPSMYIGASVQLTATPKDANGTPLSDRTVTWTTSNSAVATVSASGLVTGLAVGSATITATSEGQTGSEAVTVSTVPVASVVVSPAAANISVAGTAQLSATLKDAAGTVLTGRAVTWTSSNPAIATVSAAGLVTGVAAGTATITATSEGQSGSATVTVANLPVASVAVSPAAPNIYVGGSVQITATPKDANGTPLSGRTVTWTTSNSAVATVSPSGLVTGLAVGSATITATSEGQSGTAAVTVSTVPVASVVVSPAAANISVGGTAQLSATLKDAAGTVLTGRAVTWTSSNPAIATVSAAGLVTGVAAGTATITATSEGQSATAAISVANVPVASVVISPVTAVVLAGATVQLAATPLDAAGNVLAGRSVTWASSAPAVATVSSTGLVTGAAPGAVTITAMSEGKTGSAAVTVNPVPVALVTVSPASANLAVGQTAQLTATPRDANGKVLTGRSVTWASSAPAVATVSSTGLVTGVAAGAATITATSEGVSGTAALTIYAGTHIGSPDLEPGLLGRTDLVLFEDFEFADWETHWSKISHPENYTAVTTPWFQGNRGLEVRAPTGSHNGTSWDFTFAAEGLAEPDAIYLRYYVRFNDTWQKSGDGEIGKLPGFGGTYNRCGWGGDPGDGTCWSARMMNFDAGATNQVGFYTYHMDQGGSYGEHMRWSPLLERGRWYCVEAYVQLNSLSGGTANSDGVLRGWIDGAVAFERSNLRFRNVSATRVEKIWWDIYIGGSWTADRNMAIHFDNVVVAKQRIGCYSPPTP